MSRILIIEDNEKNRKLFRLLVTGMGHECLLANDGDEGVRFAKESRPDLILMDIQLPKLDGIAARSLLESDARTRDIPVIAVTSFAMPGDRERLMAEGFIEYIAKPVDTDTFGQVVQSVLERTHGTE